MFNYEKKILNIANTAGVTFNGDKPWDIQVHNDALYKRIALQGTLGLGEAYMDGWWDCERLDLLFEKFLTANTDSNLTFNISEILLLIGHKFRNLQSKSRASEVAEVHYDLSNDFYQRMLDERMIYSCGYWKEAKDLDTAQKEKLDLICQKLHLKEGETLLDIGCGWGGMAKFAAENYGVKVTGVTISKEQAEFAKAHCQDLPIEIKLQDYRDVEGQFDKIVSIGMFEHVGHRNYRPYMEIVNKKLKDDGLFLLHTIGHRHETISADPWVNKYIFPNAKIPSVNQIGVAINGCLILEDWHNFGVDYAKTLDAWHVNFEKLWPSYSEEYGNRFYRMWKYYLMSFAGAFRAKHMQLWQIVLTKQSNLERYHSVR